MTDWQVYVGQAITDLEAALKDSPERSRGHINDALLNLDRALEAMEN